MDGYIGLLIGIPLGALSYRAGISFAEYLSRYKQETDAAFAEWSREYAEEQEQNS